MNICPICHGRIKASDAVVNDGRAPVHFDCWVDPDSELPEGEEEGEEEDA